jgi:hypothetical protein
LGHGDDFRGNDNKPLWPQGRAGHSALLRTRDYGDESMTIFGGSCAATDIHAAGPSSELWILDTSNWKWQEVRPSKREFPTPETSHSAALVGTSDSARMVILGGTANGSGPIAITADGWILTLSSMLWQRIILTETDVVPLVGR